MNGKTIELINIEKPIECCILNILKKEKEFYRGNTKNPLLTGWYFQDDNTFFALYPTMKGAMMYYNEKEYPLRGDLTIAVQKNGKKRKFTIEEYGIEVDYLESQYIGFDPWSTELDIDLFYIIEQKYKGDDEFYKRFTLKANNPEETQQ